MKKLLLLIISLTLVLFSISACSNENTSDENDDTKQETPDENAGVNDNTNPDIDSKPVCEHVFTETVYKPAKPGIAGMMILTCKNCDYIDYAKIPALANAFELEVVNKYTLDNESDQYICVEVKITNISEKDIKMLSGNLSLIGSKILILSCNLNDLNLIAGETTTLTLYSEKLDSTDIFYEVSKSIYDTPFEELKFQFESLDIIVTE